MGGAGAFSLEFTPDGQMLAVSGLEPTASLWDVATGTQIGLELPSGGAGRTALDLSADGRHLLMTSVDGQGAVWDFDPESWKQRACAIAGRTLTRRSGRSSSPGGPTSRPAHELMAIQTDSLIGAELGDYRIESVIGRGGMGVVYLAEHQRLEREVALKVLAPELVGSDGFRQRFLQESRIAAGLNHPNVIPIHDADEADGVLFIAMRFVDGDNLAQLLEREGALPPARALALVSQVAGALDAAHARGLLHRDVTPRNVLIAEGRPRLPH